MVGNEKSSPRSDAVEDVAAAKTATADFFSAEVNRCQAELVKAQEALAEAEARRAEIAGGARLTVGECVAVHAAVQAPAFALTHALIKGTTNQTRKDYQAIREHADAVKRGLVADGYTEAKLP
ncbi:hypothetical protein [Streptomyces cyaneofuscatus]|uniref:hypothetical protein n=1 Tax=Streptomyces cyaneofuscatus TaxID=66883 RepID=UPI0033326041